MDTIQRGFKIKTDDSTLSLYQAVVLLAAGENRAALDALRPLPASPQTQFYTGMAYRALEDHTAARQAFSRSIALGNQDPYAFYELIQQDHALRDQPDGVVDFRAFYQRFPDSPWLHMLYGDAYLSKSQDTQAALEFKQALAQDPQLPIAHFYLGFIAFQNADYSSAARDLATEISRDPSFSGSYLYLGASLRRQGKNRKSLPYLREAVLRDPSSALAYHELATALLNQSLLNDALTALQTGEQKFPTDAAFPAQMASVLRRLGRQKDARDQAQKAHTLLGSVQ